MNIFLSWSGEMSQRVASALRYWLPSVIPSVRPFVSSQDISRGARWLPVLSHELQNAQYGIICVTPYNVHKPWVNFEAGKLTRLRKGFPVTPFLFQLSHASLSWPAGALPELRSN